MITFPLIEAKNLAQLNECRLSDDQYLELLPGIFADLNYCITPTLRAYAHQSITHEGDILSARSALWIHTGIAPVTLVRGPRTVRLDSKYRNTGPRRRIQSHNILKLGNVFVTDCDRTAVDLLLEDLESGIGYLPSLLRAGARYERMLDCLERIRSVAGKKRVQAVLSQLPSDIFSYNRPNHSDTSLMARPAGVHPSSTP
ncbi:hypothetical protein [Arcanobacterium bovis]|uniref:AbiEi antitoxin C-terminal domain-containing protein n=1 Tax=Arcanobacterium bovis TaxID=2529275 RepID=A0A4Q9V1C1_9ACTO|nr:hypothetical protein [Arcanobacterium bovis]TBW22886.1 hypothetical protein EZJ44_03035 [Arcanobacterium bovis]